MKNMRKMNGLFTTLSLFVILSSMNSCNDNGTGVDAFIYEGSKVTENTHYRNPVWEPDLDGGIVFRAASSYVAIGSETQWTEGNTVYTPTLMSLDLMRWTYASGQAFTSKPDTLSDGTIYKLPDWAEGRIHNISAGFARTIAVTPYWMFYQIEGQEAIGAAYAKTGSGPYLDSGMLINAQELGVEELRNPYFAVFGTSFYLYYTTNKGTYCQRLTLAREKKPKLNGAPVLVAAPGIDNVAVTRIGTNKYYLFGTIYEGDSSHITYAMATTVNGPYKDKEGNAILSDSKGTILLTSGEELVNPENVSGMFSDIDDQMYLLYNATDVSMPFLLSGFKRRPLLLTPITLDKEGWIQGEYVSKKGWIFPRFKDK